MNERYWINFYKNFTCNIPSDFAKFCAKRIKPKSLIVDAGCGNMRDSKYFHKLEFEVIAVDKAVDDSKEYKYYCISEDINRHLTWYMYSSEPTIYARFLLHAMKREEMEEMLSIISEKGYRIFAEIRSDKDENIKKDKSHKRNLVNARELIRMLLDFGYDIEYFEEGKGMAKWKNEDPIIIRFIAKR